MFNAYPQQRRPSCIKFILPLSIVGVVCLVLYAYFETSEDESSQHDDPGLKRMHPFLSSQSFEIGFWTRSASKANAPPSPTQAPEELLNLRQELEAERERSAQKDREIVELMRQGASASSSELQAERARSAQKEEEIAKLLRGGTLAVSAQTLAGKGVGDPVEDSRPQDATVESEDVTTPAPIPESLFRGPPQQEPTAVNMQAQASLRGEAFQPVIASTLPPTLPPAAIVSEAAAPKTNEYQDSTITVKTGGKEIIFQIGQDHSQDPTHDKAVTAAVATTPRPQAAQAALSTSNSSSSPERVLPKSTLNVTEEQSRASKPSARKEATQITVKSGQHSVTIELRGSDQSQKAEAVAGPPAAAVSAPPQNTTTSPPPTTKPAVQDAPDLPDYVAPIPAQALATKTGSQNVQSTPAASSQKSADVSPASPAQSKGLGSTDAAGSYANLALRAR